MQNEPSDEKSSASIRTPFGWVKITGTLLFLVLLELACTGLLFWYLLEHDKRADLGSHRRATAIVESMKAQNDLLEANLFMFGLSPEDRVRYRIDMPQALRDRLNRKRPDMEFR